MDSDDLDCFTLDQPAQVLRQLLQNHKDFIRGLDRQSGIFV